MASLDKSRIQGFGSDCSSHVWSCPAGHLLMRSSARNGKCDRCYRSIVEGEAVMDCRRCDWYVCKDCHPPAWSDDEDDSLWGTFSLFMDVASREVARGATEVEAFVSEMQQQLADATAKISCQPTTKAQLAMDDTEILPLAGQQAWNDDEDGGKARPSAAEGQRTPRCKTARPESRSPPVAAVVEDAGKEAADAEEERPAPPAQWREPTDLIDLGEESLLDAAPAAPAARGAAGSAASQKLVDLLDLPGSLPKDETLPVLDAYTAQQPAMFFAQLGA